MKFSSVSLTLYTHLRKQQCKQEAVYTSNECTSSTCKWQIIIQSNVRFKDENKY